MKLQSNNISKLIIILNLVNSVYQNQVITVIYIEISKIMQ